MKKRLTLVACLLAIAGLIFGASWGSPTATAVVPHINTLVSVNNTGNGQGGSGSSYAWADSGSSSFRISADGKHVVFTSTANNLVSGDTNGTWDVLVRDLTTGTTVRANISTSGVEANARVATGNPSVAISKTGRYVAFMTTATNLIDGQTISAGSTPHLYLRDMHTGTTTLLSKLPNGTLANGDTTRVNSISTDGRFVLFTNGGTNLDTSVSLPSSNYGYLYRLDRKDGTFQVLNAPVNSGAANSLSANMSCDGTLVVNSEFKAALTSDDTDMNHDVYLIDLRNGMTKTNLSANAAAGRAALRTNISCNGDYVVFNSNSHVFAPTLVSPTDTKDHLYILDRVTGEYALGDQTTGGIVGNGYVEEVAGVDNYGNVVFDSTATNLGPSSGVAQRIWFRNKANGTTEQITPTSVNGKSQRAGISENGKLVVYGSEASNLISSDTNGHGDVFVSQTGL